MHQRRLIKLPAYFIRFGSKADGSASLSFATQELTGNDFAELKENQNKFGWLLFKENDFSIDDLPEDDADEEKTPSQRMRAVLYIEWKQKGSVGDKNVYYRQRMDQIIEKLKKQLDGKK